ncbi:NAD(P)/FAD-dependent oxidoreductase, partial [bacterium]|nr:NAD(P)/FAD-dependent oxidoreductase [bacterium]
MGVEKREIVIIGAGPAGSTAARQAALMGLCPMLIEKDNSPGARNACGGMAAYCFRNRLQLSYEVVEREIRRTILFIDGDQIEFGGSRPTYISFQRAFFDKFLAKQAVQAGAELFTSIRVISVDPTSRRIVLKESLTGREREMLAQIIIFADGPKTLARDAFGIGHRPGPRTRHAMYWELNGPYGNGETMEIIVDTSAQTTGYFWVFPKRDR